MSENVSEVPSSSVANEVDSNPLAKDTFRGVTVISKPVTQSNEPSNRKSESNNGGGNTRSTGKVSMNMSNPKIGGSREQSSVAQKGGSRSSQISKRSDVTRKTDGKRSMATNKSADKEGKSGRNKVSSAHSKTADENTLSLTTKGSKKSKRSRPSSRESRGKRGKKGKEKVKKLNRKAIYKDLKLTDKKILDEEKRKKKLQWEKNKVFFYWNCVIGKLIDLGKRNHQLKKKQESLKMEKKNGMFHEYWKKMNETRMEREEMLDAKRTDFRSMITELRDNQKRQTDWLFKDIQTYVRDTYLIGQKYTSDVVGIRMEYTKRLTETLFEARENSRILEIVHNSKYGPAMEEFEEEMRRLRSRIPTERQERLNKMLTESKEMLVELVNVYTNILHHNFIEVCHTANIINGLKTRERRLERERNDLVKRRNRIKERTEYLHDRVSNLKRQVNAGKESRKKLHRVMKEQEVLQTKKDIAYINKELTYQENAKLTKAINEMSDKVNKWYFRVKRHFLKTVIIEAGRFKERALQLANYNRVVKNLFEVEDGFLETIDTFKDHEEFEDTKAGLKVLLGSFKPFTLGDLEKEFEGCTESFATAIIFFKRRLNQNYLSLDDLHFFIKRRSPLSFLEASKKEEKELGNTLSYIQKKRQSLMSTSLMQSLSVMSFRL